MIMPDYLIDSPHDYGFINLHILFVLSYTIINIARSR